MFDAGGRMLMLSRAPPIRYGPDNPPLGETATANGESCLPPLVAHPQIEDVFAAGSNPHRGRDRDNRQGVRSGLLLPSSHVDRR